MEIINFYYEDYKRGSIGDVRDLPNQLLILLRAYDFEMKIFDGWLEKEVHRV